MSTLFNTIFKIKLCITFFIVQYSVLLKRFSFIFNNHGSKNLLPHDHFLLLPRLRNLLVKII